MSDGGTVDLFGFGGRPARGARRAAVAPRPPVAVAPPPVIAAPPPVLALPSLPTPSSRGGRDLADASDGAMLMVTAALRGWTLSSAVYGDASATHAIRWIVSALREGGWLRDAPSARATTAPLLSVAPPVACALEVYQLLAGMIAAVQAGQVVAAPGQDDTALRDWLGSAERTLRQHRAVAIARREQHA